MMQTFIWNTQIYSVTKNSRDSQIIWAKPEARCSYKIVFIKRKACIRIKTHFCEVQYFHINKNISVGQIKLITWFSSHYIVWNGVGGHVLPLYFIELLSEINRSWHGWLIFHPFFDYRIWKLDSISPPGGLIEGGGLIDKMKF